MTILLLKKVSKLEESKVVDVNYDAQKDEVTFEDFTNMDIRTGEILEAEKVKKANKLLKLVVDTGLDKRTIVSGIAEHYSPEDIIGKKVSVLMNLAPRKIRGIESQGMILMAENEKGELSFVVPEKEFISGCGIRLITYSMKYFLSKSQVVDEFQSADFYSYDTETNCKRLYSICYRM